MKKVTNEKVLSDEGQIYEQIKQIVQSEVDTLTNIAKVRPLEFDEIKRLDILTKIYATLKDDLRGDKKADLL